MPRRPLPSARDRRDFRSGLQPCRGRLRRSQYVVLRPAASGQPEQQSFLHRSRLGRRQIFAYWNDWVSQFLVDNARFLLTEFRIDGIRYDEVRVIENEGGRRFCQRLTDTVRATNPAAIQIAEYWNEDRASALHPPPEGLGFHAHLLDRLP